MRKARNELKDLRSSIQKEVEKIAQSLRNEMGIAKAREATLQKNLDKLEGKNNDQNKAAIKLRELEREAKASQVLYANFLNRFKETSTQEGLQQADSRIISKATIPSFPSYPKKQLIIVVSTLVGVLLGVVLSLLLDLIAVGFRNTRELEEELGVSFLGITPALRRGMRPQAVANWPLEKKTSSAAESIRNIQTAIRLTDVDNPPKVLSILSTVPS
ncbi:MAG: GNVR domain-containing protein, partial [Rhodospirillaceae bacterium]